MKYPSISFFDLDHTLLKVNGSFQFGIYLYKKGFIPTPKMALLLGQYLMHKWGIISPEQLNRSACKTFFSGKMIHHIEEQVDGFLNEHLNDLHYFPVTQQLVNAHHEGHYTVILSSSPHFLVRPIAERLGVNQWESTRYAVSPSGMISHIESHVDGDVKALYVKNLCEKLQVSTKNSFAYSDSYSDIPFLQAVGCARGVNPDRKLRKYCLDNNWEIF
jgi:HAD superfamily hydrolase (TIGR01490 family)